MATKTREDREAGWTWREIAASAAVVTVIVGGYLYFVG
jgi:hypothetical protein